MAHKYLTLYLELHQPTRLRLYRFFDIGRNSHYYDDFADRSALLLASERSYLPVMSLLSGLIDKYGDRFKVAFCVSGSALEQFSRYSPEVLDAFRSLARTGNVEFLCETYYNSLSSLVSDAEFSHQVRKHMAALKEFIGVEPRVFRNTGLLFSDAIASQVGQLGFSTMLAEGASQMLGWRTPGHVYSSAGAPGMKVLLRNPGLSDDIALRFSDRTWNEWPLTAEKYLGWLKGGLDGGDETVSLVMDCDVFGLRHPGGSGIFDFLEDLAGRVIADGTFTFATPSEVAGTLSPAETLQVAHPVSWYGEGKDVEPWLGNELQQDAFNKIYGLYEKLSLVENPQLWEDFGHLQESDHFRYMSSEFFTGGGADPSSSPYDGPYEAYINYMNVLSDFMIRLDDGISMLNATFAGK